MKKLSHLLFYLILLPTMLLAQTGSKVFDNLTIKSKILNSDQKYAVYLPPGYDNSERSFPVLYLFHGHGDDQTGWIQFGEMQRIMDKAISDGSATPMVIIMPNGNNDIIGYFNTIDGKWRYEDYFFDEFMPELEKKYRIKRERRFRAIAGLSMGGGASYIYALHHPELFSSSYVMSGSPGVREDANADEKTKSYIQKYNALQQIAVLPQDKISSVRWFIDCGDDDFLSVDNCNIHIAMLAKKIPHEFRVRDGHHSWTYWRDSLPEALKFISDAFHQY